jgi:hypothetical protein
MDSEREKSIELLKIDEARDEPSPTKDTTLPGKEWIPHWVHTAIKMFKSLKKLVTNHEMLLTSEWSTGTPKAKAQPQSAYEKYVWNPWTV